MVDPRSISDREHQLIARRYIMSIHHILGVNRDIPAPDLGTNAQTMAWMMDAYGALNGYERGIVTGKPIELGGSYGREDAPGRGAAVVGEIRGRDAGMRVVGRTVGVEGEGVGTQWRGEKARERMGDAGFTAIDVEQVEGDIFNNYYIAVKK